MANEVPQWTRAFRYLSARFPTAAGFARYIGVEPSTVEAWKLPSTPPAPEVRPVLVAKAEQLRREKSIGRSAAITAVQSLRAAQEQTTLAETRVALQRGLDVLEGRILPRFDD